MTTPVFSARPLPRALEICRENRCVGELKLIGCRPFLETGLVLEAGDLQITVGGN